MINKMIITTAVLGLAGGACAKKKAATTPTDTTETTTASTTTTIAAGSSTLAVASLASVPDASSFVASASTTASALWLGENNDFNLVTGTPPSFKDIGVDSTSISKYLTGDFATLAASIETDRAAKNWSGVKTSLATYFEADGKCAVMEQTARIVSRLKEDTNTLCMLKSLGTLGDKAFAVSSGTAITDMTTVFTATAADKVLQIIDSPTSSVMFDIKGTTSVPNGFQMTMTMCDKDKVPTQQNILLINNTAGTITFSAQRNDGAKGGTSNFALAGAMVADGKGGYIVDTAKGRTVNFAQAGTFGDFTSSNQGSLAISGNILNTVFFTTHSGKDPNGKTSSGSSQNALSVQYTGTSTDDLVIYQGAGKNIGSFTGTNGNGESFTQVRSGTVAFAFDNTKSPQYPTQTTSVYLDTVTSVDFAKDAILKQSAPATPDIAMDATKCTATPTTVLKFVDNVEAVLKTAKATCEDFRQKNNGSMCNGLRAVQQKINNAMQFREKETGSAEK